MRAFVGLFKALKTYFLYSVSFHEQPHPTRAHHFQHLCLVCGPLTGQWLGLKKMMAPTSVRRSGFGHS